MQHNIPHKWHWKKGRVHSNAKYVVCASGSLNKNKIKDMSGVGSWEFLSSSINNLNESYRDRWPNETAYCK